MKVLNLITLVLLIVGGLNWGLVGLVDLDLVAAIFGADTVLSKVVYILVGASALYQLLPLYIAISTDEPEALRGRTARH